jgi:MarR family transcriptional regulator, organic hydroperoxide resistance regulator
VVTRAPTISKPELLINGTDEEFRSFIHDFLAFSQMLTDIRAGFGEHLGLTGIGYTTLISISHLQGAVGIGVNAIAEHLHLSGAFITTEVAKLVKAGLVRKRVNATDKRRVLLTVTPAGRRLLNKLAAVQAPVNDALFDTLTADEFGRLKTIMARLVPCAANGLALLAYLTELKENTGT